MKLSKLKIKKISDTETHQKSEPASALMPLSVRYPNYLHQKPILEQS